MKALIDGDILAYRIGFASEGETEPIVRARVDEFISDLLMDLEVDDYQGYLTGEGNFREQIAVTAPYKGNRTGRKPEHYDFIRQYLISSWGFQLVDGEEADDAIAIEATSLKDACIICSIDKDFDQVPGWHYNFVKRIKYYVTPDEGIRNFYAQVLTGDRVDNIIGLRGIGPAKSSRILQDLRGEQEYYKAVLDQYDGCSERVHENGRLLWLRRYEGQQWEPPSLEQSAPVSGSV